MEQQPSRPGSLSRQRSPAVGADPASPNRVGGAGEGRTTAHALDASEHETHPAIAEPPTCVADRHAAVDKVLFAVAAVMALGFVAWGFVSPTGLGTASGSALTWIT